MGWLGLGEAAKRVIERDFHGFIAAKAVRPSRNHSDFVVETLSVIEKVLQAPWRHSPTFLAYLHSKVALCPVPDKTPATVTLNRLRRPLSKFLRFYMRADTDFQKSAINAEDYSILAGI